jgi:hypothetical protein
VPRLHSRNALASQQASLAASQALSLASPDPYLPLGATAASFTLPYSLAPAAAPAVYQPQQLLQRSALPVPGYVGHPAAAPVLDPLYSGGGSGGVGPGMGMMWGMGDQVLMGPAGPGAALPGHYPGMMQPPPLPLPNALKPFTTAGAPTPVPGSSVLGAPLGMGYPGQSLGRQAGGPIGTDSVSAALASRADALSRMDPLVGQLMMRFAAFRGGRQVVP